jgi:hypothetical protein
MKVKPELQIYPSWFGIGIGTEDDRRRPLNPYQVVPEKAVGNIIHSTWCQSTWWSTWCQRPSEANGSEFFSFSFYGPPRKWISCYVRFEKIAKKEEA